MKKKSLMKNSIYNVLYRILSILFSLVSSAYVARILMAESIGKVSAAQNLVSYFTIFATMGIPTYGVQLIGKLQFKDDEKNKNFTELFIINFVLTLFCSIIYFVVIGSLDYFQSRRLLYIIAGVNILANFINVDWFYQGLQEYKYIAVRSLIIKFVSLIVLVTAVKDANDYIIYAGICSFSTVGNYILNLVKLPKLVKFSFKNLEFKKHIKHIALLFAATIAAEVYVLADTTMLEHMCGSTIVGYYTISSRIISIARSIVIAISAVFLPQLSLLHNNGEEKKFIELSNKGLHILACLSIPASIGLILVAKEMILVMFGDGFYNSILVTQILAFSITTVAFSNFLGLQILVAIGKEHVTTISTVCGAIINIILNLLLIRQFAHVGAAIASAITELMVTLIQIIFVRKYIKLNINIFKIFISAFIMTIVLILANLIPAHIFIKLILKVLVGAIIYMGFLLLLKDEFALTIINKFKFKRKSNLWKE